MMKKYLSFLLAITFVHASHDYRVFDESTADHVKRTYYENHTKQTLASVLAKKEKYGSLSRKRMGVFEAIELLNQFRDESDPDTDLPQIVHAFQTAEALRRDGRPPWLVLTGLIHDLGKMLYMFGEEQWSVVGDTFPVGCAYDKSIVFHEYFQDNPDFDNEALQTRLGIYSQGCGFKNLHMSYGHDEYLYGVMKPYLPKEALYIIRFHSFYPAHREGAYAYFMDDEDKEMMPYLKLFSQYDLYSKVPDMPPIGELRSYYEELVATFLPETLDW